MASIGHIAVGMAAARAQAPKARRALISSMLFWSALSMLPDADVIGFRFGIRYADPWGHRGASHSLLFALAVSVLLALLAHRVKASPWKVLLTAAVVIGSHPLLDTLTDGGLGCALLWPFDNTRYFAPWNPIPVAPIGARFFTGAGLGVALTELVLFAPLILYALWPRRGARSDR